MLPRALADLVVIAHLAFIAFALFGGLLALRRAWLCLLHLPAAAWGVFVEVSGSACPLTPLENRLRALAGAEGYSGGFVEHHLLPIVYPSALTREIQLALGLVVLLVNLAVYACVARRWSRARRGAAPEA